MNKSDDAKSENTPNLNYKKVIKQNRKSKKIPKRVVVESIDIVMYIVEQANKVPPSNGPIERTP